MAATAAAAAALAAFRYHPAVGLLIATILALSMARTTAAIDRGREKCAPMTTRGGLAHFLVSLGVVSAIIGVASLPGLLLVWGFAPPGSSWRVTIEVAPFAPAVVLIGAVLAIPIAYLLRRRFW